MLDLAGDAAGNIYLGVNGDTRLTNLTVVVNPTCIYRGTGSTYFTMEQVSQLEELVETFLASHAITAGYNDGRTLQVVLGSLHVVVEHFYNEVLGRHILAHFGVNHFLLALTLVDVLLHHTRANSSHLRTVLRVDDGSHDVATEGRTNLIEQTVKVLARLLLVVVANLQLRTVGSQTAGQGRRNTGTEVTADDSGTHQGNLWVLLLEEVHENVGMGSRGIWEQALGIENK